MKLNHSDFYREEPYRLELVARCLKNLAMGQGSPPNLLYLQR